VILVTQDSGSLKWSVVCDIHGEIGNGQTTAEYALERAMDHNGFHPHFRVLLLRHSGNKWSIWEPQQVWKWVPDIEAGTRSTRRLIEKRARER
jgi:hypothetical protein